MPIYPAIQAAGLRLPNNRQDAYPGLPATAQQIVQAEAAQN